MKASKGVSNRFNISNAATMMMPRRAHLPTLPTSVFGSFLLRLPRERLTPIMANTAATTMSPLTIRLNVSELPMSCG